MTWLLVLVLLFAVAVALFAAQNGQTVEVMFLFWTLHTTLAVVILGAALTGAVAAALFGLVTHVRLRLRLRRAEQQLHKLQVRPPEAAPQAAEEAPGAPAARDGETASPTGTVSG
ncbi:MAG: DUF1049 domain-containing protein [Clostridia bacterium]|nr:DUF1049 domain-containing protein [Clostridia bacterium]